MFAEIYNDILSLTREPLKVLNTRTKELDIVTVCISVFNLSNDCDLYEKIKIDHNNKIIYIMYDNLYENYNKYIIHETVLYKGEPYLFIIIDKNTCIFNSNNNEEENILSLTIYFSLIYEVNIHLMRKNINYITTNSEDNINIVFKHSPYILFIYLTLNIFIDTKDLRSTLLEIFNINIKDEDKMITEELISFYFEICSNSSLDLSILDNSLIIGLLNDNEKQSDHIGGDE